MTNKQTDNSHKADHLKPHWWKPGESGNPKGKTPNKKVVSEWIREILSEIPDNQLENMTRGELLARAIVNKAMQGDMRAVEIALDRGEGKVMLPIGGDRDSPIYLIRASEAGKADIERVMKGEGT